MNNFIESQQELARKSIIRFNNLCHVEIMPVAYEKTMNEITTQIIQNTGEELMRLAEGEGKAPYDDDDGDWKIHYQGYDEAIDHLKEHIASVTGVK